MPFLLLLLAVILTVALFMYILPLVLIAFLFYVIYRLIRYYRKEKYFKSDSFLQQKEKVSDLTAEYNEISNYVQSLPIDTFISDNSKKHKYSNLGKYENTSLFNIKRDKYKKELDSQYTHYASLAVVKRASEEPIKYLCKYFDIKIADDTLTSLQEIEENISRFINARENLDLRQQNIVDDLNPPKFITKHYQDELMQRLNVNVPTIELNYPEYVFEYVSAGGNSSQRYSIIFDENVIEATTSYVAEKLERKKTAKTQRSLMTKKLREYIKERDNYTCKHCNVSVSEQSLLLLEVDHIIPVSKGGMSTENNLQTLCWKCNRSKSDKII